MAAIFPWRDTPLLWRESNFISTPFSPFECLKTDMLTECFYHKDDKKTSDLASARLLHFVSWAFHFSAYASL
jgi:hypothetical protein